MPDSRIGMCLAASVSSIAVRFASILSGLSPRSPSLAPSSTSAASAPSPSAQSSRARPPAVVSPETAASMKVTSRPALRSAACICAWNASAAGKPYPAVRLSPSTSTRTGRASAPAETSSATASKALASQRRAPYGAIMDINVGSQPDLGPPLVGVRDLRLTVPSAAGPVNILCGIDLDVREREAVGIVGPSGSGKTSLLMVLAGLEQATSGTVRVAGRELTRLGEDALARFRRLTIGIVFQAFHLIPAMTALENVAVPLELAGVPDAGPRARASLEAVGLGHRLTHLPGQLSGGEQQRVALARAFAPRPRLLLADEPTGNLDHATGSAVMDVLFGLQAEHGTTLLLITHDPALATRCDRQIRLADGRVVGPEPSPAGGRGQGEGGRPGAENLRPAAASHPHPTPLPPAGEGAAGA